MITKEDLKNYKKNEEYIQSQLESIRERYDQLQKLTTSYNNLPHVQSPIYDRFAENLVKLIDMHNDIIASITLQIKKQEEIRKLIENVKIDAKYRNILYDFYILGKTMEEVAVDNGYEYKYTCKLNGLALEELKKQIAKKEVE